VHVTHKFQQMMSLAVVSFMSRKCKSSNCTEYWRLLFWWIVQDAVEFLNERNRDDAFFTIATEKLSLLQVSLFVGFISQYLLLTLLP